MLRDMGHAVTVVDDLDGRPAPDLLIALHGSKSHDAIAALHRKAKVIVAMTGTDLYPEPNDRTHESLRLADRIIVLQPAALERIPPSLRGKTRLIVQSATASPAIRTLDPFDVCVVGHLREIKDPMRAAAAARLLPASSKIRILHAGAILEAGFADVVAQERKQNPRYEWLGLLSPEEIPALIASCQLQVLSSFHEGGARVLGESVVAGTPVLAARNDATVSLLGEDYAGLFDAGATGELADLMERYETDRAFQTILQQRTAEVAGSFDPAGEREALRRLVEELE